MASIAREKNGTRRVLFTAPDGSRKTVRLGKVNQRHAEAVKVRIEQLLAAKITGHAVESDTAVWLTGIDTVLTDKLARVGLVPKADAKSATTLGAFCDAYVARRTDIKAASLLAVGQAVRNLKSFFGEGRTLESLTPGDAEDFRRWLATDARSESHGRRRTNSAGLSPATVGRRLKYARNLIGDAVKRRLIAANPFADLKTPASTNPDRLAYVPVADVERLIEATPDREWKLLLAMSRHLGVRVPSEPFSLTWNDIDWERGRIRLPSPKTAVHGKTVRVVPILPEIRPHLEAVWEAAAEGATYVFAKLRERDSTKAAEQGYWANVNLRQHLIRLIARAGLKAWPRLWHNLRSSAQTDLANRFPAHVVCDWLGNTAIVAVNHYLQVTDAHFEAAQSGAVHVGKLPPVHATPVQGTAETSGNSAPCKAVQTRLRRKTQVVHNIR